MNIISPSLKELASYMKQGKYAELIYNSVSPPFIDLQISIIQNETPLVRGRLALLEGGFFLKLGVSHEEFHRGNASAPYRFEVQSNVTTGIGRGFYLNVPIIPDQVRYEEKLVDEREGVVVPVSPDLMQARLEILNLASHLRHISRRRIR